MTDHGQLRTNDIRKYGPSRPDPRTPAGRYRDERDALRSQLATVQRELERLDAINAALVRVIADAIDRTLNSTPPPTEENPR